LINSLESETPKPLAHDDSVETEFVEHRVTLHPTPEGKARTESIGEKEFDANE
jgi:hypothetical protein